MSRDDSNACFQLSLTQASLDSEVSNRNDTETSSITSSRLFQNEYISKIIQILHLDKSNGLSEILVRRLMIKGRQALRDDQQDVSKEVFDEQMNTDHSKLLEILKTYFEQQWKETISEEWFHQFLREQKSQSTTIYNKVLTRIAEHGLTCGNDNNALLSLTIQFLFGLDIETMENDDLLNQIRNTLISEGRHGIQHYKKYISSKFFQEQLENNQSPLYLALRDYYNLPLENLFKDEEVNIHDIEIFQIALDSVANHGWWFGLHHNKVTDSIAPRKFNKLIEKLKEYLISQDLPIPNQSSSSNNNSAGTPTLINTSSPVQSSVTSPLTDRIEAGSSTVLSNTENSTTHYDSSTTINIMINADDIRRQDCKIISMCINENEKLQLSNLIEAGELMYIDQKLDSILDKIIEDYRLKKNFPLFIHACFIPIMYLLKRHQNLDNFIESLFFKYSQIDSSSIAPKLNLRMIIHILLLNSDISLSRKVMSLLSKRNPVPFLQPSLTNDITSYQFVSDIIHVWDYSIPTLLSFGIGPSQGKSTLINTIFFSSFESSISSIYFQNTIDVDFGYNFLPRRSINIADSHGSMMKSLLEQIHELFDGFLIHVEYSYLMNNIHSIHDYFKIMRKNNSYCLLIVRDTPIDQHKQCSIFLSSKFPSIETFLLPNIVDQNNKHNKHFILTIRDKIWEKMPALCKHDMNYLKNQLKHLMNNEYQQHLDQMYKIIVPLEKALLKTARNKSLVKQFFPEYLKFVELCELKLKLARCNFYGKANNDFRRKIFQLENASDINDVYNPSIIYKLFFNVLKASNMLTCIEFLIDELKQERVYVVSNADMTKQFPIQKSLSLEILWRNAIICSQNESEGIQKYLQQQYYQYIQAGFPFEIIDGDNFYFPYSFLLKTFEPFRNRRTLVISVIGLQKSGKSTLLNYMFGTLFDVRYTRGIYGSFLKTNRSDFEYIMLIDSEGLLDIEREDSEYDHRIVLFCLAVSHLVLVNIVGEISTTLQSILTLHIDLLEKIDVTKFRQPIVHFILNQQADLNIENHQAAIDRIISDLKKLGLDHSLDIRKETFHTLPSAFKNERQTLTSNSKLLNVVKTAPEFLDGVQLLSANIIRSAALYLHRSNEFFDPLQWLSSSRTIFDTLEKFSDLTYYRNIHERRLDNQIREYIRSDLTKIFSADYRDKLILESSHKTEQEINELFRIQQNQIEKIVQQNVENLLKLLNMSHLLRQRSEQFLNVQITEMFNALRTSTIAVNGREEVKLIVQNGEGDLRKLIEDIIQSGRHMPLNVAAEKFDQIFDKIIQSIKIRFDPSAHLKQAIEYIYTNYNIYEKECLLEYGDIASHLRSLSNLYDNQTSIAQVEDELIRHFTQLGYQHSSVAVHDFNSTTRYSLDTIKNLIHLRKDLLEQAFSHYVDKHQQKDGDQYHNQNYTERVVSYVVPALHGSKDDKQVQQLNVASTDQFQLEIRDVIRKQKPMTSSGTVLDEHHMYFGTSKVFTEVIARIVKTMKGIENGQVREVRTELIQKIVGLINSLIIDIDNELVAFGLSLSHSLKSTFHTCAVVLLIKYYYDEQINHFTQTLSELQMKKNDLKKYFLSMVVPNALV